MNMAVKKISFILGLAIVFSLLLIGVVTAGTLRESNISLTDVYQSSVVWGDYNNDGYLDLVLTGYDGTDRYCEIYQNSGSPNYNFTLDQSLTGVSEGSLAWGDYDRDGDLDLIVTGLPGPVSILYRNDDGTFIDSGESLVGVQYSSVAWGDWDNDGDLDLALAGWNETVSPFRHFIIYENDSGTFSVGQNLSTTDGVRYASLAWADYDNDGDLDLAVAGNAASEFVTKIYKNHPLGNLNEDTSQSLTGVENGFLAWGDYDNDGDLDLALMGSSDTGLILRIYQNIGPTTYKLNVSTSLAGVQNGSLAWGDYDNDGDLDLAVNGQDSLENRVAKIYENSDTLNYTFSEDTSQTYLTDVRYASLAWADYDDDKDLDLVMTGEKSGGAAFSKIYYNNETTANEIPQPPDSSGFETIYATSTKTLTIKWTDGADSGGSGPTPVSGLYYNIRIGSESGADDLVAARYGTPLLGNFLSKKKDSKNIRSFQLYAKGYFWSVQTIDNSLGYSWSAESTETGWSEEKEYEDTTPPPAPSTPLDEGEATYSTRITLSWTQPQEDPETKIYNYRLQVKESSTETGDPAGLDSIFDGSVGDVFSKKVSGCKHWKYYYARVKAQSGYVSHDGYGDWSGWSDGIQVVRLLDVSNNLIHPRTEDNEAKIKYYLIRPTWVNLKIYNLIGELVTTLVDKQTKTAGPHEQPWQGVNSSGEIVASGIYIVHIEIEGAYATEKICVVK